jgi:formylglycine-generating enzyme required for sulfatase activity
MDARLGDPKTLVSLSSIYEQLKDCPSAAKVLLVDACRVNPEPGGGKFAAKVEREAKDFTAPPGGIAALFSCSKGEASWESDKLKHGVFFHFVLEGLRGQAANDKGTVLIESLAGYVKSKVDDFVKDERQSVRVAQTPHLRGDIRGSVVLLDTGKPPTSEAVVDQPQTWETDLGVGVKLTLRLVPAGKFLMGATKEEIDQILKDDKDAKREWYDNEFPQHEVEITKSFYMGVTEVTQEQYEKVMGKNPSRFTEKNGGGPKHPVERVSWKDAVEFCAKLTEKEKTRLRGLVFRLPTEAEWEYACRGGPSSKNNKSAPFYFAEPTFGLDSSLANFDGNHPHGGADKGIYRQKTTPVGDFQPNPLGLYDMHGNVWEWCHDWFGEDFYSDPKAGKDPTGPATGTIRVPRGGSWDLIGRYCRAACRSGYVPGLRLSGFDGFRVALAPRIP